MKALVVDYANGVISLSSAFEKKAFTPGTSEYAQLMAVRNDFPGFRLATRQFKTNTKQDRYKGLTYDFMREYIKRVEGNDAPAVLEGLEDMIEISKCHSTCKRYPSVKKWFLERYPDVETFGMSDEELAKWKEKKEAAAKEQATSDPKANKVTAFPNSEAVKPSESQSQEKTESVSDTVEDLPSAINE